MATIPDWEQEVPLLLVSWSCTTNPTNVIILDSSIAISVDQNTTSNADECNNDSCCFDIVSRKEHKNFNTGTVSKIQNHQTSSNNNWKKNMNQIIQTVT